MNLDHHLARMDKPAPRMPRVQGRCPACGKRCLFLADDDYVTCSWIECTDPTAACDLLEGDPL